MIYIEAEKYGTIHFDENDWRKKALEGDSDYFEKNSFDIEDEYGMNPLMYSILGKGFFDSVVLAKFIENSDLSHRNYFGQTAYGIYLTISNVAYPNEMALCLWGAGREKFIQDGSGENASSIKSLLNPAIDEDDERWRDYLRKIYSENESKYGEVTIKDSLTYSNNARCVRKVFNSLEVDNLRSENEIKQAIGLAEEEHHVAYCRSIIKDEFETTEEYKERAEKEYLNLPLVSYKSFTAKLPIEKLTQIVDGTSGLDANKVEEALAKSLVGKEMQKAKKGYELSSIYRFPDADLTLVKYDADKSIYYLALGRYVFSIGMKRDMAKKFKQGEINYSYDVIVEGSEDAYDLSLKLMFETGEKFEPECIRVRQYYKMLEEPTLIL